jgi:hypothetical protein
LLSRAAMLRTLASIAVLGAAVGCSGSAPEAHPAADAHTVFAEPVSQLLAGDERLFLFTNDALVSIPKAGGAPITIGRLEPYSTASWHRLSRGGGLVVASMDGRGPVVVVDEHTSQIVASWQPAADFRAVAWKITSVATDGARVFLGVVDVDGSSIVALPARTLAGTPETLVRHDNVVVDLGQGKRTSDDFTVKHIVADGAAVYYAYEEEHVTYACPTCGAVVDSAHPTRNVLARRAGAASTNLYEARSIEEIALGDDAVWVLERIGERKHAVKRVPKNGGPVGDFAVGEVGLLGALGTKAFVPTSFDAGSIEGIRTVNVGETAWLRAPADLRAFAVDDDFVYASLIVTVDDCPSGGKGCIGRRRTVYSGVDRMPRAR